MQQLVEYGRILLVNLWIVLMVVTILFASKDPKILMFSILLVFSLLLLTHERRKWLAILQWGSGLIYMTFLAVIAIIGPINIAILMLVTVLEGIFLLKRIKKE